MKRNNEGIFFFNFGKADFERMQSALRNVDWNSLSSETAMAHK